MAFSKAHIAILVLCLAAFCIPALSVRSLRGISNPGVGSACLLPGSQDQLPAQPGPFDQDPDPLADKYYCFGFQFTSTHEPTPIVTTFKTEWFRLIGNPLVNPLAYLQTSDEESVFDEVAENSPLYYPLDGAFGSGVNGTGYGGAPYLVNKVTGKYVYSVAYQILAGRSDVSTAKINKALRNLGKRFLRFFPVKDASKRRPGVIDFEITTFWVRQDPRVNGPTRQYNVSDADGFPTPVRRPKGCQYV